ncbi:MAG: lipid A biosynthesis acyltransferase [Chryseolinea sp.]
MPKWHGKSKGTALGYRILFIICSRLGVRPAYFILRFVAFYFLLFSRASTQNSYSYFRQRHGYGVLRSIASAYKNYYLFAQTILDKVIVMAGINNNLTYDFDGEENLRKIVVQGRGGILLSGHVGNWEAAGYLLKRLEIPINVVMYDGEHEQIKEYLNKVTGGRNLNVILIKDDMSHVYAMGEALQKNELICLHADRFIEGNKTTIQNFLGSEALFPLGPFLLSSSFRVPVSIVFAFKESSTHYHFYGSDLIERKSAESKTDFMDRLSESFVSQLEQKVRMYPEQWFNYFNFWAK